MAKAPYTPSPKNVREFFQAIQNLGTPPKVNVAYLPTIGFKSSNDRSLVTLCKTLGFIDNTGSPTDKWNDFRDKTKAPKVMADVIKTAYTDLYVTYPDAEKRDDDALQNYFASTTKVSTKISRLMVQTFKNLCNFADFESTGVEVPTPQAATPTLEKVREVMTGIKPISININIQLQIPATEDATIYDKLFSALKKHLFS